jgi:ribonuclease HI
MSKVQSKATFYIDGASRGNPGKAAIGVVITNPNGTKDTFSQALDGKQTNNEAEFRALQQALVIAAESGWSEVQIYTDSKLVANAVTGKWRLKSSSLIKIVKEISLIIHKMPEAKIHVDWVPRGENGIKEADKLCNEILNPRILEPKILFTPSQIRSGI